MAEILTLNKYYRQRFNSKVYKLSLNGGMTCPNRDGNLDTRGCIFCSQGGSGDFAASPFLSVSEQIEQAKHLIQSKNKSGKYIAYFQAYTNTYAPVSYLDKLYTEAISCKDIVGLSIATRPDCLSDEIISLLARINKTIPVFIELGLQTIHQKTADFIRRGYDLKCFDDAVNKLSNAGIETIVHLIIGLPGETISDIISSVDYLSNTSISGVKLQLLHVLKGTDLADYYYKHQEQFSITLDQYTQIIGECIEHLRKDIVIHRITGDGPKSLMISPMWSTDKKRVLNYLNRYFTSHNITQGRKFTKYGN